MGSPYVGEIRMFAGNFAPAGWSFCNGALVAISENDTLFSLIGTTYGGDGQNTFGLPNLQGRVPLHQGSGFVLGQMAGVESVTLNTNQMPNHTHTVMASTNSNSAALPGGNFLATGPDIYDQNKAGTTTMAATISPVGGNQPHDNMQPYLVLNFIISLFGIYPSQG